MTLFEFVRDTGRGGDDKDTKEHEYEGQSPSQANRNLNNPGKKCILSGSDFDFGRDTS